MKKLIPLLLLLIIKPIMASANIIPSYAYHATFGSAVPDLSRLEHLRFLTSDDFYPFNYRPQKGMPLAGYNIDLMRSICKELQVLPKCEVEPVPFEQLTVNLEKGEGDAIIAGLSEQAPGLPQNIAFSMPYMLFPARFLCLDSNVARHKPLIQQHIGVLQNTKHLAMLRSYFPNIKYSEYSKMEDLTKALQEKSIDAIFGDGRVLAALKGPYSFEGQAYYNQNYLGTGMKIATLAKRNDILEAMNYAIAQLAKKGELYMIYLRYFPRSFY